MAETSHSTGISQVFKLAPNELPKRQVTVEFVEYPKKQDPNVPSYLRPFSGDKVEYAWEKLSFTGGKISFDGGLPARVLGRADSKQGLDVKFNVTKVAGDTVFPTGTIEIYNLNKESIAFLTEPKRPKWEKGIRVYAGYGTQAHQASYETSPESLVFDGYVTGVKVEQVAGKSSTQSPTIDVLYKIKAESSYDIAYKNISQYLRGPITVKEIFTNAAGWMGMGATWHKELEKLGAEKRQAFWFWGNGVTLIQRLRQAYNIDVFIDDNFLVARMKPEDRINADKKNQFIDFICNSKNGMINAPSILENGGVEVKMLLDPTIRRGGRFKVESKTVPQANGTYLVNKIVHDGDLSGQNFYTTVTGSKEGAATVTSEKAEAEKDEKVEESGVPKEDTLSPLASETPPDAMISMFNQFSMNFQCCLPAVVQKYDRKTNIVTLQPAIKTVHSASGGSSGHYTSSKPQIDLPVLNMAGAGFGINFPLQKGDTGWIIAADRDTSGFTENRVESAPKEYFFHLYQYGFFIPDQVRGFQINDDAKEDKGAVVIQSLDGTTKFSIREDKAKLWVDGVGITVEPYPDKNAPYKIKMVGDTHIKGNVTIEGNVTIKGDLKVEKAGTATGKIDATGEIKSDVNVIAKDIKLKDGHKHKVGNSTSGTAIP